MNSANDSSKQTDKEKATMAAEFFASGDNDSEQQAEGERSAADARIVECTATLSARSLTTGPAEFRTALRDTQRWVIGQAGFMLADEPNDAERADGWRLVIDTARTIKATIRDVDTLLMTVPRGGGKRGEPRIAAIDALKVAQQAGVSGTPPHLQRVVLLALALLAADRAMSLAQDVTNQLGDPVRAMSIAAFLLQRAAHCAADAAVHSAVKDLSDHEQRLRRAQTSNATSKLKKNRNALRAEMDNWLTSELANASKKSSALSIARRVMAGLDKAPQPVREYLEKLRRKEGGDPEGAIAKRVRIIRKRSS